MSTDNRSIPVTVSRPGGATGDPRVAPTADESQETRGQHTPLIDIHEGADGLVLEADLPGADENNLKIELEDNVLSLFARVSSPVPEGARVLHEEYRVGDFVRSFILSDEVERGKITAELKN